MSVVESREAFRVPQRKVSVAVHHHVRPRLPATEQLLVEGGDARIALDPHFATNQYGCQALPDPGLAAFASSTASVISETGFAAADCLRQRLLVAAQLESPAATYARELNRMRRELIGLCDLADLPDLNVAFAASGTDIHLLAAQLVRGTASAPTLAVMVDAAETGSGVPAALAGRHFSNRTALGAAAMQGAAITAGRSIEIASVPIRLDDGSPRPAADVDADVESLVARASAAKRRVLLILVDVSKTGLIAPSPACVAALHHRLPNTVHVLVDACQWRIAPSTLRAYLERGFMVALTGSKFLTGPSFSGALLIPAATTPQLRAGPLPPTLRAYSAVADWPHDLAAARSLGQAANFGLLLRWEAALAELRAFRAVPETMVSGFLHAFAQAVGERLRGDPLFEPLPMPQLNRRPLIAGDSWDHIQTIFPFLLYRPASRGDRVPLNQDETTQVYRLLQKDLGAVTGLGSTRTDRGIASLRCQFGQPVTCGQRGGLAVSALRLCASARLILEAAGSGRSVATVIETALAALDKTAWVIRHLDSVCAAGD